MKGVDQDILHQVITELMEDASPDKEERIVQAIRDVKKDLSSKQRNFRSLTSKLEKIEGLIKSLSSNGSDASTKLIIELLKKRRISLESDLESINLSKMVKKLGYLEQELESVKVNQDIIEQIRENLHG